MIFQTNSLSIYNACIVPNLSDGIKENPIKRARVEGKDAAVIKYYNDCFEPSIKQVPEVDPFPHEFGVMRSRCRSGGRNSPASAASSDSETLTPGNG